MRARPANGKLQIELQDSVACAKELMQAAKSVSEVLWIGPTPLDESVNPLCTEFDTWTTYNEQIAGYDKAYVELAQNLGVDYLRLFPEILQSERYRAALVSGDGIHPGDDGYAMVAEKISAWSAWQQYL